MKKILACISLSVILTGCTAPSKATVSSVETVVPENPVLPEKTLPQSPLASESPLNAQNIDRFMFLKNVQYIDLRSIEQVVSEGSIAGFMVIPFYEVIASWNESSDALFTINKLSNREKYPGDIGTYSANFHESETVIRDLFQSDHPIIFFSTAGVEAAYMINLLAQCGYDPALLYNAGSFTNSVGDTISYRDYQDHQYFTAGTDVYTVHSTYSFGELTRSS